MSATNDLNSSVIINPGSGPVMAGDGWTNTYEKALETAKEWLARMRADGIDDVTIDIRDRECRDGRWTFGFRHGVTGVVVELETHGIDNLDAYVKRALFHPRVYWAGSSCSEPTLEDWAASGYRPVKTYWSAS